MDARDRVDRAAGAFRRRSRERGLALLVIVAVLAALFVMGWTLFLFMKLESRSGENLAHNERARNAALGKLERAMQALASSDRAFDSTTASCGWYAFQSGDADVDIYDLDGRFNLNAMGSPDDLGTELDQRQRFASFETSLVRLLLATVKTSNYDPAADPVKHRNFCIRLARELAERRYGAPRDPLDASTRPRPGAPNANDFDLSHTWGWSIAGNWTEASDDVGVDIGGVLYGWLDGYPSIWRSGITFDYVAEPNMWRGQFGAAYNDDVGTTYPADTNNQRELGWRDGIPSAIRDLAGVRRAEGNVANAPTVDEFAEFDPDHPVGDDRAYASVYEVPPIIKDVLIRYEGMSATEAATESEAVFACIRDHLCVHSHNRRARVPSATGGHDGAQVSINDWASDRIDNDGDGLVDEDDEGWSVDGPQQLAEKLGLVAWADAPYYWATPDPVLQDRRRQYATQMLANILDFRDDDDVPTSVTLQFTVGAAATKTALGTEGLHITELLATPEPYPVDGDELINGNINPPAVPPWVPRPPGRPPWLPWPPTGGQGSARGWYWRPAEEYYEQGDPGDVRGHFLFTGLPDGWYALKFFSPIQNSPLTLYQQDNTPIATVLCSQGPQNGLYYGYARGAANELLAFQVSGQALRLFIEGPEGAGFKTVQLLPQLVEIVNIAQHAPTRSTSHGINIGGFTLALSAGAFSSSIPIAQGKYYDAYTGTPSSATTVVAAAHGDGVFPVDYGWFVVAMSEAAYARQWGRNAIGGPEYNNDVWGDHIGEDYPVFFIGDQGATVAERDANAEKFLFPGANLTVSLSNGPTLMAGGAVDGLGGAGVTLTPYVSLEKTAPTTSFSLHTWADCALPGTVLKASQNRNVWVPAAPAHGQANPVQVRTNLNTRFDPLYDGNPDAFKSMDQLANERIVLPIVLNRPYTSPAWLGLVPADAAFRTVDADPTPGDGPAETYELLGTLVANAIIGGDYARLNLNTASEPVLKALFDDVTVQQIVAQRAIAPWQSWDALLNEPSFTDFSAGPPPCVGFFDAAGWEDSGACSYADDFPNDSDEKEEWFRRFSNLVDIRSTTFLVKARGRVPIPGETGAFATAEIEAVIDRDRDRNGDGVADCQRVEFRFVTETP